MKYPTPEQMAKVGKKRLKRALAIVKNDKDEPCALEGKCPVDVFGCCNDCALDMRYEGRIKFIQDELDRRNNKNKQLDIAYNGYYAPVKKYCFYGDTKKYKIYIEHTKEQQMADEKNLVSLANSEQFPRGVGVAINKKMLALREDGSVVGEFEAKCWSGFCFFFDHTISNNACFPPVKRTVPMTNADVFKLIREGAVVRRKIFDNVSNNWNTTYLPDAYVYCRDYTGTNADVWMPMTKEVEE